MPGQDSIDELRRVVGEDARFQRRVWVAQRAGWVALGAFVLLAAVGGLGDGPLAAIEATSPDGALRIRHDAVARQDSAMHWHVVLPPGSRALTITSDALEGMEVHNIQPATARQSRGQDWLTLQFDPAGDETSRVMLTIEPITPGLAAFTVTSGHREASFRTVVLP